MRPATLLTSWFEAFSVEGISVLTRLATEWYVFAEELITLRPKSGPKAGRLLECRKAAVYPIAPGGRLQGQLGWGTDLTDARESLDREVGGIRYLQDGEAPDTLGDLLRRRADVRTSGIGGRPARTPAQICLSGRRAMETRR